MPHCDCPTLCKGGKEVSRRTYRDHARYRTSKLSSAFNQFIAGETAARFGIPNSVPGPIPPAPSTRIDTENDTDGLDSDHNMGELDQTDPDMDLYDRQDGSFDNEQATYNDNADLNHEDLNLESSANQTTNLRDDTEMDLPQDSDTESDTDDVDPQHIQGPGDRAPSDTTRTTSRIEDVRDALEFIDFLKEARLENSGLSDVDIHRLRNPTPLSADPLNDPDFRLSLDVFLACTNSSQATYHGIRAAILRRYPDSGLLSYDQIKRRIKNFTGIIPTMHDMCVNSCIAYTGPFEKLESCPECYEPRYQPTPECDEDDDDRDEETQHVKVPRQQFSTLPLGPQLQALWAQEKSAQDMRYRERYTNEIWEKLCLNGGVLDMYDDFCCGSDYLKAVEEGQISPNDMVLLFSIDGAQLYRNKKSDCWIYIWVILDLPPDKQYKMKHVLPGGFIPGNPQHLSSFMYPGLYHISALQHEGLSIYDGFQQVYFSSKPFLAFATADAVAMAELNGWVGHHGKYGCRYICGLPGRFKPGTKGTHYYPALLKPHNYVASGCDHPDIDINTLPESSPALYHQKLRHIIESPNPTQYTRRRRETGLSKPSLFHGLSRTLPLPNCFPGDSMHVSALNIPDLLLSLWRGTMVCDKRDNKESWDWVVLKDDSWVVHGKLVADTTPYIPGSYGRTPRNPAEKISSGYKACEFLIYVYGLGPALLYCLLPRPYWCNFCKLVRGIRLILQRSISKSDLIAAHQILLEFLVEFEVLYVQRRVDRLHFVRQCLHALSHLAPQVFRVGPVALLAQWVMERTIGNLGREIRQPSNPYANLAQRGLFRSQINALKAMIPDLESDTAALPYGSMDIGDGYALLRKRDATAHQVPERQATAIRSYLNDINEAQVQVWDGSVTRWARLALPNGQIVRSVWNEKSKKRVPRRARNVTLIIEGAVRFAEVLFFFIQIIDHSRKKLALVSLFGLPDEQLQVSSSNTLWVCRYSGENNLVVVDAKSIQSVVMMAPFPPPDDPTDADLELYYVHQDIGFDVADLDVTTDFASDTI